MSRYFYRGATLAIILLTALCGCVSDTYVAPIEVKSGTSFTEKRNAAKQFCNEKRLAMLRTEVKGRLAGTSDSQVAGLALRCVENASQGTVIIMVGMDTRSVQNATRIVDTAAQIVNTEIHGQSASPR